MEDEYNCSFGAGRPVTELPTVGKESRMANRILYQFYCNEDDLPFEVMMTLDELEEYDKGKEDIPCPLCQEPLNKLICPARLSSSRCTL